MRFFRRSLVVVSATAATTVALVTIAMAGSIVAGFSFTGTSKHKHYGVTLLPQCFTSGCTRATTIGVQITTGNPKHAAGRCVYGTFQLPNAKLRNGRFAVTGQASAGNKLITLKASGRFTTPRRAHGTVTGPRVCGGTDTFRATETLAAG